MITGGRDQAIRSIFDEVIVEGEKVTRIHSAWQLSTGSVLLYEYTSCNRPPSSICLFDNLANYLEACEEVSWIRNQPFLREVIL